MLDFRRVTREKLYPEVIDVRKKVYTTEYRYFSQKMGEENDLLYYVFVGSGELCCGGENTEFSTGDLFYVPRNSEYSYSLKSDSNVVLYSVEFKIYSGDIRRGVLPECISLTNTLFLFDSGKICSNRVIGIIIERLFENWTGNYVGKELLVTSDFYKLMYELNGVFDDSSDIPYYDEIKEGIKYIESNYLEEFKVEDVARKCGVCVSRFYKFFKECTGLTPIEYKNRLKVNNAIELLKNRDYSIEEISSALNFCNQSYFIRMFKKFTGHTPRELIVDSGVTKK